MTVDIRPSPIAGTWYPGSAESLRLALDSYLGDAPESSYEALYGVMVPHAGMRFSGSVAGSAFRHLIGRRYDVVVVISPSHHRYPHALLTSGHDAFRTPSGVVPIAKESLEALRKKIDMLPVRDDEEHAIEIELPFLQYTLGDFHLLPFAMIDQSYAAAKTLAGALTDVLTGRNVLYVASSDLSHFYDQKTANSLDRVVLDAIAVYDAAEVIAVEDERRGFACGRGAIATVMLAARESGASVATIEAYATSGDTFGDYSRVVGYGAATFHN